MGFHSGFKGLMTHLFRKLFVFVWNSKFQCLDRGRLPLALIRSEFSPLNPSPANVENMVSL